MESAIYFSSGYEACFPQMTSLCRYVFYLNLPCPALPRAKLSTLGFQCWNPPPPPPPPIADDIFKCIFVNGKFCILIKISPRFVPKGRRIGSLAPNRWQAIIRTNADPIHWRIYAMLGGVERGWGWGVVREGGGEEGGGGGGTKLISYFSFQYAATLGMLFILQLVVGLLAVFLHVKVGLRHHLYHYIGTKWASLCLKSLTTPQFVLLSALLALCVGNHRWPMDSHSKGPVMRMKTRSSVYQLMAWHITRVVHQ